MAELDTITLVNPTDEDFTHNFNGEPYTIKAKEHKNFVGPVGKHLARHLAIKMVEASFSKKDKNDPKKAVTITQHLVFDNPKLRIQLYRVLNDVDLVARVILSYPFKAFIGEMSEYETFVSKAKAEKDKSTIPAPSAAAPSVPTKSTDRSTPSVAKLN